VIIRAQHPESTAAALAALTGTPAAMGPGGAWTVGTDLRVLPGTSGRPRIERLLLPIGQPVERVIEIACTHGFHAEELGRSGFVEFWIGENMLVELVTTDATDEALLAA